MKTIIIAISMLASATAMAAHHGKILTNQSGMTLYTFDKDAKGVSNCNGGCAEKWPPYFAQEGAKVKKGWSIVSRSDGSQQWAYQGQPLYTWIGDSKKGDTNGNGVGGVWHVAEKAASAKKVAQHDKPTERYGSGY